MCNKEIFDEFHIKLSNTIRWMECESFDRCENLYVYINIYNFVS